MFRSILLLTLSLVSVQGNEITVSDSCVDVGERIQVTYTSSENDRSNSFLGIYPVNSLGNINDLPRGDMWVWLCGSQECDSNRAEGTVRFKRDQQGWQQDWPIVAGNYRAVMVKEEDDQPWSALAESETFQVGCDNGLRSEGGSNTNGGGSDVGSNTNQPNNMVPVIESARRDIEDLISNNDLLIGKFLRLAFHDCVGGCDGCVDFANSDNAGLVMPIDALESVVDDFKDRGLSRTDVWMLAAAVASEVSADDEGFTFPFQWIGRKTCEELNNNNCGRDARGMNSGCGPFSGPHRVLCHADTSGTQTIHDFMLENFGFDAQQTAAIMGAHSVGAMRDVNLGFEGRSGWDLTNDELDHGYYHELIGDGDDPIDDAPNWDQVFHRNHNLDDIPGRWQYEVRVDSTRLTMLNSDVAMVRNLVEGENLESDGRITCNFKGNNRCSSNTPFMRFIIQYRDSRTEFLRDYEDALELMIENGYRRDDTCGRNEVCVLSSRN